MPAGIKQSKERGEENMRSTYERYVIMNKKTGEIKEFVSFENLRLWWRHLTIEESFEWGGWNYVSSSEFNCGKEDIG